MAQEIDPYQVLGVSRRAGSEEIRQAFHRCVLLCHPDCCDGDAELAKNRFSQTVAAYRFLRERLVEEKRDDGKEIVPADRFDPADFAWLSMGWDNTAGRGAPSPAKMEWLPRVEQEKVVTPAYNETSAFVLWWVVGIVLALAGGVAIAAITGGGPAGESTVGLTLLIMLGIYVGVFAVALAVIVGSRKTSWLLRVIGFRRQHSLPGAAKGHKLTEE